MIKILQKKLFLVSIFAFCFQLSAQTIFMNPTGKTNINGVDITNIKSGFVTQFNTLPPDAIPAKPNNSYYFNFNAAYRVGVGTADMTLPNNAPWNLTLKFSQPVNNVYFVLYAAGATHSPASEYFNFSINNSTPLSISLIETHNLYVSGNTITGIINAPADDLKGGGVFKISSTKDFTEISMSGGGGLGGSFLGLHSFTKEVGQTNFCTNPPSTGTPNSYTKVGITTQNKLDNWPENIPNGFLALESKEKGMVISRIENTTLIKEPKEGMLTYDKTAKCVKLYNGEIWNCIKTTCNETRKARIGTWSGYTINDKAVFRSQLNFRFNYGIDGLYNKIAGFEVTDITTTLDYLTVDQLIDQYDIINTGYSYMSLENAKKIKEYVDRGGVALIFLDAGSMVGSNLHQIFGGTGTIDSESTQPATATTTSHAINNGIWGNSKSISLMGYASSGLLNTSQLPPGSIQLANNGSKARVWITGNEGRAIFTWDEGIFEPQNTTYVSNYDINTYQEIFIHNLMTYALDKSHAVNN